MELRAAPSETRIKGKKDSICRLSLSIENKIKRRKTKLCPNDFFIKFLEKEGNSKITSRGKIPQNVIWLTINIRGYFSGRNTICIKKEELL